MSLCEFAGPVELVFSGGFNRGAKPVPCSSERELGFVSKIVSVGGAMITHKLVRRIQKDGHLELNNLPFKEGTKLEVIVSRKERMNNLQELISNDHVWSEEDIKAVNHGRDIINQWQIS